MIHSFYYVKSSFGVAVWALLEEIGEILFPWDISHHHVATRLQERRFYGRPDKRLHGRHHAHPARHGLRAARQLTAGRWHLHGVLSSSDVRRVWNLETQLHGYGMFELTSWDLRSFAYRSVVSMFFCKKMFSVLVFGRTLNVCDRLMMPKSNFEWE